MDRCIEFVSAAQTPSGGFVDSPLAEGQEDPSIMTTHSGLSFLWTVGSLGSLKYDSGSFLTSRFRRSDFTVVAGGFLESDQHAVPLVSSTYFALRSLRILGLPLEAYRLPVVAFLETCWQVRHGIGGFRSAPSAESAFDRNMLHSCYAICTLFEREMLHVKPEDVPFVDLDQFLRYVVLCRSRPVGGVTYREASLMRARSWPGGGWFAPNLHITRHVAHVLALLRHEFPNKKEDLEQTARDVKLEEFWNLMTMSGRRAVVPGYYLERGRGWDLLRKATDFFLSPKGTDWFYARRPIRFRSLPFYTTAGAMAVVLISGILLLVASHDDARIRLFLLGPLGLFLIASLDVVYWLLTEGGLKITKDRFQEARHRQLNG